MPHKVDAGNCFVAWKPSQWALGHLGFAVVQFSSDSFLQANLTIKIIYFWSRLIKINYPQSNSLNKKCKNCIFHDRKSQDNWKCPALTISKVSWQYKDDQHTASQSPPQDDETAFEFDLCVILWLSHDLIMYYNYWWYWLISKAYYYSDRQDN